MQLDEHDVVGMQARGLMGQLASSLSRGSPPGHSHTLFTHPVSSSLQTSANPSAVFLLTSSAPDPVAFSQGPVHSPTFLTQFTPQVPQSTPKVSQPALYIPHRDPKCACQVSWCVSGAALHISEPSCPCSHSPAVLDMPGGCCLSAWPPTNMTPQLMPLISANLDIPASSL